MKKKKVMRAKGETLQSLFSRSLKYCKYGRGYRFLDTGFPATRRPADFIWQGEEFDALIECKQITSKNLRFDFFNHLYQNGQLNSLIDYAKINLRKKAFVCLNFTNRGIFSRNRIDEFYLIDYRFFEFAVSKGTMKGLTLQYVKDNEVRLIRSGLFLRLDKISIGEDLEKERILNLAGVLR